LGLKTPWNPLFALVARILRKTLWRRSFPFRKDWEEFLPLNAYWEDFLPLNAYAPALGLKA